MQQIYRFQCKYDNEIVISIAEVNRHLAFLKLSNFVDHNAYDLILTEPISNTPKWTPNKQEHKPSSLEYMFCVEHPVKDELIFTQAENYDEAYEKIQKYQNIKNRTILYVLEEIKNIVFRSQLSEELSTPENQLIKTYIKII